MVDPDAPLPTLKLGTIVDKSSKLAIPCLAIASPEIASTDIGMSWILVSRLVAETMISSSSAATPMGDTATLQARTNGVKQKFFQ